MKNNVKVQEDTQSLQSCVSGSFIIEKGNRSFCDGHGTRYWKFMITNLKRKISHYIETFDNDLKCNKKYHCCIDYRGCVGERTFYTDNFKEAVGWITKRLENYR